MAKEAILQIRIDAETKKQAEVLFETMGTSLSEAVRIFIKQSLIRGAMPFPILSTANTANGILANYADPSKIPMEEGAWEREAIKKHRKEEP